MATRTGRVTCDLTITLDGFSAGHNQTEERPFGDDGDNAGVCKTPLRRRSMFPELALTVT